MNRLVSILTILFLSALCSVNAQEKRDDVKSETVRPVMSAYMVDLGSASVLDTYLSSIRYKGVNLRLSYERMQAMKFNPDKWIMQLEAGVDYSPAKNPSKDISIHTLMADFKWGMMHRWRVSPELQLFGGGNAEFRGGALYAPANSNNVVSVKINMGLNFTGMAVYNRKIGRLPVIFRYQATLPIVSASYSPEYGESYYEMYVGNHSGLVYVGWIGNHFTMQNLLTADMHFGNTTLRVGYRGVIETSWVNNLNTQIFRNSLVLGVCGEWISVKPGSSLSEKVKTISAMY